MILQKNNFVYSCVLCGCFLFPSKSLAFDYKEYNKEHHQIRSLKSQSTLTPTTQGKEDKESAIKEFTHKVLEALNSDLVPVKMFDASNEWSLYFKPAKISKLGFKYKF